MPIQPCDGVAILVPEVLADFVPRSTKLRPRWLFKGTHHRADIFKAQAELLQALAQPLPAVNPLSLTDEQLATLSQQPAWQALAERRARLQQALAALPAIPKRQPWYRRKTQQGFQVYRDWLDQQLMLCRQAQSALLQQSAVRLAEQSALIAAPLRDALTEDCQATIALSRKFAVELREISRLSQADQEASAAEKQFIAPDIASLQSTLNKEQAVEVALVSGAQMLLRKLPLLQEIGIAPALQQLLEKMADTGPVQWQLAEALPLLGSYVEKLAGIAELLQRVGVDIEIREQLPALRAQVTQLHTGLLWQKALREKQAAMIYKLLVQLNELGLDGFYPLLEHQLAQWDKLDTLQKQQIWEQLPDFLSKVRAEIAIISSSRKQHLQNAESVFNFHKAQLLKKLRQTWQAIQAQLEAPACQAVGGNYKARATQAQTVSEQNELASDLAGAIANQEQAAAFQQNWQTELTKLQKEAPAVTAAIVTAQSFKRQTAPQPGKSTFSLAGLWQSLSLFSCKPAAPDTSPTPPGLGVDVSRSITPVVSRS